MFHNIPTPFEILSKSFHKVAFIYKSKTGGSIEMSSFYLLNVVYMALI